MRLTKIGDRHLEFLLPSLRRIVGNLKLEAARDGRRRIDDLPVELVERLSPRRDGLGQARKLRIQANTEQ